MNPLIYVVTQGNLSKSIDKKLLKFVFSKKATKFDKFDFM